jgi:ribosomal protein S18 acetylase RimI-like enzyme
MADVTVDPLLVGDARVAGGLLAASHGEYPAFRLLFPDPAMRARVLRPFMASAARDAARYGRPLAARVDGRLVGVALWMPPGRFPVSPLRKARMVPGLARSALAAGARFPRFARVGAALERELPDGQFWYLQAMGIHPSAQRQGVGSALMAAGLALVDADNLVCHLHTSDQANLDYYHRWGFESTQPAVHAGTEGPTYYGMTRPPARPRR